MLQQGQNLGKKTLLFYEYDQCYKFLDLIKVQSQKLNRKNSPDQCLFLIELFIQLYFLPLITRFFLQLTLVLYPKLLSLIFWPKALGQLSFLHGHFWVFLLLYHKIFCFIFSLQVGWECVCVPISRDASKANHTPWPLFHVLPSSFFV